MTTHGNLTLTDTSATAGGGCSCGHGHAADADTAPTSTVPEMPEIPEMAECPVMAGTPVVKADAEAAGLYRDHQGQRYWFCCAGCGPRFDADPDRYANAA
ncbi:YHS domain-containing protein [Corynebacterium kalidii]|uniref:YHS domain-containing protein n=1 Tax=Corynebacterium kalidii TaxID=2931982 RepID=A0A9X1WGI5_9CORY|nr:YHS domain-containing protein [Corynebacterium kalidii]MCJ7858200.1 YHS domain-containing protein [Corynebacterium kalidii]